jgi:V8-like Glu-specific endopeptidase
MKVSNVKFLVLAAVLTVFGAAAHADNEVEKIIGKDQLVAVDADATNIPKKFQKLVDAFGIISMGCTATHIGNGYVLTAGHCFDAYPTLSHNLDCSDVTVAWGVREGKEAYMTSNCEKVIAAQQDDVNDFAIFKVSPVPPASVKVDLSAKITQGDRVTLFSHPEELPLRWSKYCVVQSKLDPMFSPDTLQHKCDTNPGSSGATILDAFTGMVVGIHDGGYLSNPTRHFGVNYGTYVTNQPVSDELKALGF